MLLAERLALPGSIDAVLFDLDGVLVDTVTLEAALVDDLLQLELPGAPRIPDELFRRAFPLPISDSWTLILESLGVGADEQLVAQLTTRLEKSRVEHTPSVLPGIVEVLADADDRVRVAVVSNNPADHVKAILRSTGLARDGLVVVGNDQGLPSKPAPDMYAFAARRLGVEPADCAAVEDSSIGALAARGAGCFVVGVATGAESFRELERCPAVDRLYRRFEAPTVSFSIGEVAEKRLDTPNEFVSHMVEHIAWRAGCGVQLAWPSNDWQALGYEIGRAFSPLLVEDGESRAMGLIDDGSAEIVLTRPSDGVVDLVAVTEELDWFLNLRVEQLRSGHALVDLLTGLAEGAALRVDIRVGSIDDAHHTWEAVFRGMGLALRDLSPILQRQATDYLATRDRSTGHLGLSVERSTDQAAVVKRTTAESLCRAAVDLADGDFQTVIESSSSVHMDGLVELVNSLADAGAFHGSISFRATELSSSHVVAEDIGLTLGAALRELAIVRMDTSGVEGFGWSEVPIGPSEKLKVALSWEGRKFLKLLPVGWSDEELKRFRVGATLSNGIFSEDLDDFLDGFVGGMQASLIVHWPRTDDLDSSWRAIFRGLGASLRMALHVNRPRRGLTAGVKATLA